MSKLPELLNVCSSKLFIQIALLTVLAGVPLFSQTLGKGDGVRLTAYNISDNMSGDYYVQDNWHIQLPFVGLIDVRAREIMDVRQEIIDKYRNIYRDPELTVQALYRINVLGEVREPGVYYVTGVENLSDVLAQAGGETRDASIARIYVVRADQRMNINAEEILEKGHRLNDIGLRSGDQIYVPRKRWLSFRSASVLISTLALSIAIYDRSSK